MADAAPPEAALAARHASMRYLGMPLFILGALGIVAALGLWLFGDGKGGWVFLYVGATGLSLATFGTHNDTAIAFMLRASETEGALPEKLAGELSWEMERDRAGTQALTATPKTAFVMTGIALALHALAGSRFLTLM